MAASLSGRGLCHLLAAPGSGAEKTQRQQADPGLWRSTSPTPSLIPITGLLEFPLVPCSVFGVEKPYKKSTGLLETVKGTLLLESPCALDDNARFHKGVTKPPRHSILVENMTN